MTDILEDWVKSAAAAARNRRPTLAPPRYFHQTISESLSVDEQNEEVNVMVGYAVFKIRGHYYKNEIKSSSCQEQAAINTYVDRMRTLHGAAMADAEYLENCYSISDRMRNLSGYTLVSKQYFVFGRHLMCKIRSLVSKDVMEEERNKVQSEALQKIRTDGALYKQFLGCDKTTTVPEATRKEMYFRLCEHAVHARFRENVKTYSEQYTSRYSVSASNLTFRAQLAERSKKFATKRSEQMDERLELQRQQKRRKTNNERNRRNIIHTKVQYNTFIEMRALQQSRGLPWY